MNESAFDADALIEAMAPLLGLVIGEASRAPVKAHLEIAARYAALLYYRFQEEDPAGAR